jgi:uridine kinase
MSGRSTAFFVGIAGGTGSGKTTLARGLAERYAPGGAVLLDQDSYYHDRRHLPHEERAQINYDEPAAVDFVRLAEDLERLRRGEPVSKPSYSFVEHAPTGQFDQVEPAPLVIVEGLFAYWDERVRELMGLSVFLEAIEEVRFRRRLERDLKERGRTEASVREQFEKTVRPMHRRYVEPLKSFASLVLDTNSTSVEASLEEIVRALSAAWPTPGGSPHFS